MQDPFVGDGSFQRNVFCRLQSSRSNWLGELRSGSGSGTNRACVILWERMTNPKIIMSNKQSSGSPEPLSYKQRLSQYNRKLAALLTRVESEKARYWLANTDITEPTVSIPINRFLDSSSNSWTKKMNCSLTLDLPWLCISTSLRKCT